MIASGGCLGPHAERIPHELLSEMLENVYGSAYTQVLAIAIAGGSIHRGGQYLIAQQGTTERERL
jgi:hypothetical protein